MRGHVEVGHGDIRAEGVLPHVGNSRRHALVVRVGVVADLDVERLAAFTVPGFLHQFDCLVFAVELRHLGEVGLGCSIATETIWNEGVGRQLCTGVDLLGQEVAIDGHRQGLADAHVAIGLLTGVEDVVIGRSRRRNADLFAIAFLQAVDLVGREVVDEVHFLGFETTDRSGLIVDRVEDDLVDLGVGGIPVVFVLHHDEVVVRYMAFELVGAVRYHHAGLHEVLAVLFDACLGDGKGGLVGQQFEEERRCAL